MRAAKNLATLEEIATAMAEERRPATGEYDEALAMAEEAEAEAEAEYDAFAGGSAGS